MSAEEVRLAAATESKGYQGLYQPSVASSASALAPAAGSTFDYRAVGIGAALALGAVSLAIAAVLTRRRWSRVARSHV
jgi:hypothetical protein